MATPTVTFLNNDIYPDVEALPKINEKRTFKKDKLVSNSYTLSVKNIDDKYSVNNTRSFLSNIKWLYESIVVTGTKGETIWNGVVTAIKRNHQTKKAVIESKSSFFSLRNQIIEYESSDWETPADAVKNIFDANGFTDYDNASMQKSINDYEAASCYIKANINRSSGQKLQNAVEKIAEYGNADLYNHNNKIYFVHWVPQTASGVSFTVGESDIQTAPVVVEDEPNIINQYKVGYTDDAGTFGVATDTTIGSVSRNRYGQKDLSEFNSGDERSQIKIKDLVSATYIGEGYIKRTHKNVTTNPQPLTRITFGLKWDFKDLLNLTTKFKFTLSDESWVDKVFEIFEFTINEDNRSIGITALPQGSDSQSMQHAIDYIAPAKTRDYSNLQIAYATASTVTVSWDSMYIESKDVGALSSVTLDITNAGDLGLDANDTKTNNTTYFVHAISSSDFATNISAMFSSSDSAPVTMPAGYTKSRRMGLVRVDGSGNLLSFRQHDDKLTYTTKVETISSGSATSATAVDFSAYYPASNIVGNAIVHMKLNVGTASTARAAFLDGYLAGAYVNQIKMEMYSVASGSDTFSEMAEIKTTNGFLRYVVNNAAANFWCSVYSLELNL
jgi:hypothetical protein